MKSTSKLNIFDTGSPARMETSRVWHFRTRIFDIGGCGPPIWRGRIEMAQD
jgi:hypothetical protein